MDAEYCDQCKVFLEIPGKSSGRCLMLEEDAHEGLLQLGITDKCRIEVYRNGSDEACSRVQSRLPGELMEHILENESEERRWNS